MPGTAITAASPARRRGDAHGAIAVAGVSDAKWQNLNPGRCLVTTRTTQL